MNTKVIERYQRDWRDWNDAERALRRVVHAVQCDWLGRVFWESDVVAEMNRRLYFELRALSMNPSQYEARPVARGIPMSLTVRLVDLKEEAWEKARIEALEKGLKDDQ